jgi:DNA-binding SARP family transcriptional activator
MRDRITWPSARDDGELRFGVLGPVTVWRGRTELPCGPGRHQRLLAVLLLRVDEWVGRPELIESLWGGAAPRSADNQVQKFAGRLRAVFGPDGDVLTSTGGGYRLRIAPEQLDSVQFVRHLDSARAAGTPADAEAELRAALALWRGPLLDGIELATRSTELTQLDEQRVTASENLAELTLARGEQDTVVAELNQLAGHHPLRERLRELQMLALYRQGRQAEALGVFADVSRLLADELGVDPGAPLRRLHEQILRADPALDLTGAPNPALLAQPRPVHQLPIDVCDFTGRAESLAALVELLSTDAPDRPPPVVVITGGPGVGKSSLAVHAAHAVRANFPDGQLYLDLGGTADPPREPAELLAEVLRVFAVAGAVMPQRQQERAALFRSLLADRRVLIVLDDAGRAEQVRALLPATGGCAVLVTSRQLLTELAGARHIDLDALPVTEAHELLGGIVGTDRVAAEPDDAAAILAACGCLPLAIRIAGARLTGRPAWSLRVLRERLADESGRLSELRVGEVGVRASFELSRRLLSTEAAHTLSLLGLLGAHTLPGWVVDPLLDRSGADSVLDQLVDASLVRLTGTDDIGQPRYRLHDLIRAYSVETAATIPPADRRAALAAWLDLLEADLEKRATATLTDAERTHLTSALAKIITELADATPLE